MERVHGSVRRSAGERRRFEDAAYRELYQRDPRFLEIPDSRHSRGVQSYGYSERYPHYYEPTPAEYPQMAMPGPSTSLNYPAPQSSSQLQDRSFPSCHVVPPLMSSRFPHHASSPRRGNRPTPYCSDYAGARRHCLPREQEEPLGLGHPIPKEISEAFGKWKTSDGSVPDPKAALKSYKLVFEDENFSLNPPELDHWVVRAATSMGILYSVQQVDSRWLKTQYSVAAIAAPLIPLYAELSKRNKDDATYKAVRSALQLTGRAFAHISHQRRLAVLSQTHPDYKCLANDKTALPSHDSKLLFSKKFHKALLREVEFDNMLWECGAR